MPAGSNAENEINVSGDSQLSMNASVLAAAERSRKTKRKMTAPVTSQQVFCLSLTVAIKWLILGLHDFLMIDIVNNSII